MVHVAGLVIARVSALFGLSIIREPPLPICKAASCTGQMPPKPMSSELRAPRNQHDRTRYVGMIAPEPFFARMLSSRRARAGRPADPVRMIFRARLGLWPAGFAFSAAPLVSVWRG